MNNKQKSIDSIFFFTETAFLLSTCGIALYNIYFDKNMIPLLLILGAYILTIKALRKIVVNPSELKKKSARITTIACLSVSTYGALHLGIMMLLNH